MEADPSCVFDLLYTEQRLGGFHCPGAYIWPTGAEESFNFMTTPLAVELMIRLPESVRAAGTLQEAIVREAWPDLLQLPFNKAISPKLEAALVWEKAMEVPVRIRNRVKLDRAERRTAAHA